MNLPFPLPTETVFKVERLPSGNKNEYLIYGYWVAKNFIKERHLIESDYMTAPEMNGVEMKFKFLNPLNRTTAPLSIIVFLKGVNTDYPMVMLTRLINVQDYSKSRGKETNVVFNKTALRSYMDYNIKWEDVLEADSGFLCGDSRSDIVIEFELKHTVQQEPITPIPLSELMKRPEPTRQIKRLYFESSRKELGHVGINYSGTSNWLLADFALVLYHIPYFTNLCKNIDRKMIKEAPPALELNKFYNELNKSESSVNSIELLKAFETGEYFDFTEFDYTTVTNFFQKLDAYPASKHVASAARIECTNIKMKGETILEIEPRENFCLNLPFPAEIEINLEELFKRYQTEGTTISDYVFKGEKIDMYHHDIIDKVPDILVLTVDRVQFSANGECSTKTNRIIIPKLLNIELLKESNESFKGKGEYHLAGLIVSTRDHGVQKNIAYVKDEKNEWLSIDGREVQRKSEEKVLNIKNASIFVYERQDLNKCRHIDVITAEDIQKSTLRNEPGFGFAKGSEIMVPVGSDLQTEIQNIYNKDNLFITELNGHRPLGSEHLGLPSRIAVVEYLFKDDVEKPMPVFVKFFFGIDDKHSPCEFLFAALVDPKKHAECLEKHILEKIGAEGGKLSYSFCYDECCEGSLIHLLPNETIDLAEIDGVAMIVAQFSGEPPSFSHPRAPMEKSSYKRPPKALVPPGKMVEEHIFVPGEDAESEVPQSAEWFFSGLLRPVVLVPCDESGEGDVAFFLPSMIPIDSAKDVMCVSEIKVRNSHGELVEIGEDLSSIAAEQDTTMKPTYVFCDD